jgi:hypothetical protein
VVLADENLVSMNWMYSTAVGGVKVLVPVDRVEEAQSLLDTIAVLEEETPSTPNSQCPTPNHSQLPIPS